MGYCSICGKKIEQESGLCEECKSKSSIEGGMDALLNTIGTSEDLLSHNDNVSEDDSLEDIDMNEFDLNSLTGASDDVEEPAMDNVMNTGKQDGTDNPDAALSPEAIEALFAQMTSDSGDVIGDESVQLIDDDIAGEPAAAEEPWESDEAAEVTDTDTDTMEEPAAATEPWESDEAAEVTDTDADTMEEPAAATEPWESDEAAEVTDTDTDTVEDPVAASEPWKSDEAAEVTDTDTDTVEKLDEAPEPEEPVDVIAADTMAGSEGSDDLGDIDIDNIDLMSLLTTGDDSFEMMDDVLDADETQDDADMAETGVTDAVEAGLGEQEHLKDTPYTNDGRANVINNGFDGNSGADILIDSDLLKPEDEEAAGQSMADVFSDALSALSSGQDEAYTDNGQMEALLDNVRDNTKKKKKGFKEKFGKLFGNIVDEKEIEKAKTEKAEAEQAEKDKEEETRAKKEQAEADKQAKQAAKEAKAREKEEQRQIKEARKQAKREEKQLRELEEAEEIEGRINKAGATIVFVVLGVMAAFIFFGTSMFSYSNSIKNAQSYFDKGDYSRSYNELLGVDIKESDQLLYQKVVTVMHVYKQLEAYDAYYKESKYPEALDALLKGIREYEKYMPDAVELDVTSNLESIKAQIVTEMETEFGITEDMAKEINQITDCAEYSRRVYDLAQNVAGNMQISAADVLSVTRKRNML